MVWEAGSLGSGAGGRDGTSLQPPANEGRGRESWVGRGGGGGGGRGRGGGGGVGGGSTGFEVSARAAERSEGIYADLQDAYDTFLWGGGVGSGRHQIIACFRIRSGGRASGSVITSNP